MSTFLKKLFSVLSVLLLVLYLLPIYERPVLAAGWTISSHHESSGAVSSGASVSIATVNTGDSLFVTFDSNQSTSATISTVSPTGGTCSTAFAKIVGQTFTGNIDAEIWAASNCQSSITAVTFTSVSNTWVFAVYAISSMTAVVTTDGTNTASGASDGGNPTTNAPSVTTLLPNDFIVSTFDPVHSVVSPTNAAWSCDCFNFGPFGYVTSNSAAAGTYGTQWNTNGSAAFSAVIAAFKSTASVLSSGFPMVIRFRHHQRKNPADRRKILVQKT